jgi:ATP-dependent Clp protease adaptor protein ClpS
MSTTIELPGTFEDERLSDGFGLGAAWRVVVLNDDHNTFDHVAHSLARTLPHVTIDQGFAFADRIHRAGLAVVWSGHQELAEHYWACLEGAGLTMAPLEQG